MQLRHISGKRQEQDHMDLRRRQAAVGSSLVGSLAVAAVPLVQKQLSKRVAHRHAQGLTGGHSHALTLALHAANIALAVAGPRNRSSRLPFLPVVASVTSGGRALSAFAYLLRRRHGKTCAYCLTDALTHLATFALTLPETSHALKQIRRRFRENQ